MFYCEHEPTREEINRERYHAEIAEAIEESQHHGEGAWEEPWPFGPKIEAKPELEEVPF